ETVSRRAGSPDLDTAHSLEARAGMNFALRQDRRLRPEALDDTAHEWPNFRRGYQGRRFRLAGGLLEALADQVDKFGQARWLPRQWPLVVLSDQRLGVLL